jgi:hypothetical protein
LDSLSVLVSKPSRAARPAFDIERLIVGAPPEGRRNVRQRLAKPRLDELATWLDAQLQRIPGKTDLAGPPSAMPARDGRR